MSDHQRLQHAKVKMIRYRILAILDAGRPLPVGESLILDILIDADLDATMNDVRRALQYLNDKRFVEIVKHPTHWDARLLPDGIDYLEDSDARDVGIVRPSV